MNSNKVNFDNQERWQFTEIDSNKINHLSNEYGLDPLLAKLLCLRKLDSHAEINIKDFLSPPESLLKETQGISSQDHLSLALNRLSLAKKNKEKILINGDPDADGITGTAVLVIGLRELGFNVSYDFPTRCTEGHGLHPRIIDDAKRENVKLILTVDCGTREVKSIEYANKQGLDVIVCDHHRIGKTLPPALAIINPYLVEGENPMKVLSGSSIGFKLIIALYKHLNIEMSEQLLNDLTGITSLGTISDRMSLLSPQNRVIVKKGISAINKTKKEGLKALKAICAKKQSKH